MHDLLDSVPIKYKVGDVIVEINHKHENKLRILKMQMDNWAKGFSPKNIPNHELLARNYDADVKRIDLLFGMLKTGAAKSLTRDEMMEMNVLFKRYGGIRKKK
jgi:hypothetical protein